MNVKFVDLTFSKRLRIVRRFIEQDGPVGLIRRRAEQLQVDVGLNVEVVTDALRACEDMNDVRGHFPIARFLIDQRANHRSLVHGVRAKPTIDREASRGEVCATLGTTFVALPIGSRRRCARGEVPVGTRVENLDRVAQPRLPFGDVEA